MPQITERFSPANRGIFFGENLGKLAGRFFRGEAAFRKGRSGESGGNPSDVAAFPREKKTTSLAGPGWVAAFPRRETAAPIFPYIRSGTTKGQGKASDQP
ncbi:hypothetical protein CEJ87_18320, partial [Caldifermentibacillus hisashii]